MFLRKQEISLFCKISERKKTKKKNWETERTRQKIGIRRAETQQFPLGNRDQVACLGFFNSHDTQFSDPYAIFNCSKWLDSIDRAISNQAAMHERAHAGILEWGLKRPAVNSISSLPSLRSPRWKRDQKVKKKAKKTNVRTHTTRKCQRCFHRPERFFVCEYGQPSLQCAEAGANTSHLHHTRLYCCSFELDTLPIYSRHNFTP